MRISDLPEALAPRAVALWEQTGLTRPWNDAASDLRRTLHGAASTVLAARDAEGLLGTAMVGHDGHRALVYYLAVRPDARHRGVGRALMAACEEWTRARSVPKIQVMVRRDNETASGFYRRLGYEDGDVAVLGRFLSPAANGL